MGQGDEPHYIVITESLLLDWDVDVSNNYLSPWLRDFKPPNDHHSFLKSDGKEYPSHSIGMPLLQVPILGFAHLLLRWLPIDSFRSSQTERWILIKNCFSLAMMGVSSFLCVFLFHFFKSLVDDAKLCWWISFTLSTSPPLLSLGFLNFPEMISGFVILRLAFQILIRKKITFFDFFWLAPGFT